jgi:hemerythrin-like metal-binding protein
VYIHWDRTYETGQPLIDAEHRLLVMLFRKLDIAIKLKLPGITIARIVVETQRFVEFHFISEENLMVETGYRGLDAHRAVHRTLLAQFKAMAAKLAVHREYPDDLLYFLVDWLIEHIANEDQNVARHALVSSARPVAELIYAEYLAPTSSRAEADRADAA